ncbi:unnamed protein product [Vitrella brassicaformis CCMP3155]|uniref:Centrosomal protein of 19 kDa n=1 Tax=Vitrella brassicaformis (strain CCMP3155) TaxID=1169540 RepID=A0A0G4FY69_VITBC|nr:unnamed protein product [Vitrella brassicaformis CCMP3155]|eukprot:CEM20295.1 unnamed protein product [Vitrella brassicaformis CCMP3155]
MPGVVHVDDGATCKARRIGFKHDPPSIVIEMYNPTLGKLQIRPIVLASLQPDSPVDRVERCIRKHFPGHCKGVASEQLTSNIRRLQMSMAGRRPDAGIKLQPLKPSAKEKDDSISPLPRIIPSSINNPSPMIAADDTEGDSRPPLSWIHPQENGKQGDAAAHDFSHVDLNKVSAEELERAKGKMEESFLRNQVKPGDDGFVYDRRVDFDSRGEPPHDSGWDSE